MVGLKRCSACKKTKNKKQTNKQTKKKRYIHIFQNPFVANKHRKKNQLKELK